MFSKLIRYSDLSPDVIQTWLDLIANDPAYNSPFFHPYFVANVASVRDDVFILLAGTSDKIDFILPLQKYGSRADPIAAPINDYHGPILSRRWDGDWSEILKSVGLRTFGFTSLTNIHRVSRETTEKCREGAHICDLSSGFEAFLQRRNELYPKYMKNLRRLSRRSEKDFDGFEFNFDDRSADDWDNVIHLKRDQYEETGRHNVLGVSWTQNLLKRLWNEGHSDCRVYLHTLRAKGELVAAEINLLGRGTLHSWIVGYCKEYKDYAPGCVLHLKVAEAACARGIDIYDLGPNESHYKKYFSDYMVPVSSGECTSRPPPTHRRLNQRGHVMRSPVISRLFGKVSRRYAVIRAAETTTIGRVKGVFSAIRRA